MPGRIQQYAAIWIDVTGVASRVWQQCRDEPSGMNPGSSNWFECRHLVNRVAQFSLIFEVGEEDLSEGQRVEAANNQCIEGQGVEGIL